MSKSEVSAAKHTPGRAGFDEAVAAIAAGQAKAHSLWVLLSDESEREGYWLKPMPWEGRGEYQRVSYKDGRNGFVRLPMCENLNAAAKRIAKATGSAQ